MIIGGQDSSTVGKNPVGDDKNLVSVEQNLSNSERSLLIGVACRLTGAARLPASNVPEKIDALSNAPIVAWTAALDAAPVDACRRNYGTARFGPGVKSRYAIGGKFVFGSKV